MQLPLDSMERPFCDCAGRGVACEGLVCTGFTVASNLVSVRVESGLAP